MEEVFDAWTVLLRALARCTHLQRLRLSILGGVHTGMLVLSHSIQLAATLQPLTALTDLHLSAIKETVAEGSHCRMHGRILGSALAALTALQSLRICNGEDRLEMLEPQYVLDACAAMTGLTRLGLCMTTAHEVQLADLVSKLPALKQLQVGRSLLPHDEISEDATLEALDALCPDLEPCLCDCGDSYSDA